MNDSRYEKELSDNRLGSLCWLKTANCHKYCRAFDRLSGKCMILEMLKDLVYDVTEDEENY